MYIRLQSKELLLADYLYLMADRGWPTSLVCVAKIDSDEAKHRPRQLRIHST
jgi:hypothetical protein